MEDPFTTSRLLQACLEALKAIILNAWPRISEPVHRMAILKILVVCWGKSDLEEGSEVKEELKEVGTLFFKVVEARNGKGMKSDVEKLMVVDPTLAQLFGNK